MQQVGKYRIAERSTLRTLVSGQQRGYPQAQTTCRSRGRTQCEYQTKDSVRVNTAAVLGLKGSCALFRSPPHRDYQPDARALGGKNWK